MNAMRLTRQQARVVAALLGRHTITTSADLAGMTGTQVAELRRVTGIRLDSSGRLMDPARLIERLVDAAIDAWEMTDSFSACQRRRERAEQIQADGSRYAQPRGAAKYGLDAATVRAWATSVGIAVHSSALIRNDVYEAYLAAHPREATP